MLKKFEIIDLGWAAFKEIISLVPDLDIITTDPGSGEDEPNFRVKIQTKNSYQTFLVMMSTLGTPKRIRSSTHSLAWMIKNDPDTYGVVVAPYISPKSAKICSESGIGYIDLSGNCLLAFKQVFIHRENFSNKFQFKSELSSIYSPKSERILRVLLNFPYRPWRVIELADEAQVSPGMITHVSKKLEEEEWLRRSQDGIILVKPDQLLADWKTNNNLNRNKITNYFTMKQSLEVEKEIANICKIENITYALTGFSAANYLAPMVKGQRAMVYINREIDRIALKAGLKPVESGANLALITPYDEGVFWNTQIINNIIVANPITVFLDLMNYPGRGEEAADSILKEVIEPTWQQASMNIQIS